jgi:uncharacterized alpha-E superfamily protein
MTNSEAKHRMLSLIESCDTYEQAVQALAAAVKLQWVSDAKAPASLVVALDALHAAADAFSLVDSDLA